MILAKAAQKVLGQADLATTLRHDASFTGEETRVAVEALASQVFGESWSSPLLHYRILLAARPDLASALL